MYLVEIIWTFMVDYTKRWGVRRHSHDYYQLYYCIAGEGIAQLEGEDIVLGKHSCLLIRPGQIHGLHPIETGQFRTIDTKFYVHDERIRHAIDNSPQHIVITDSSFRDLQQSMRDEWVTSSPFAKEMAESLFLQSLLLILRNNSTIIAKPPFYRILKDRTGKLSGVEKDIAEYLSAHYLENLSLDVIARNLRYSKNYLCKIFKRASGYTINEYITCLRISKAYDLVSCTNQRLTDISMQCGFSSIHYFSRTFRRIVGLTPSQVRDREVNSINMDIRLHGTFKYRYYCADEASAE